MHKQKLLKMSRLPATPEIISLAESEKPTYEYYGYAKRYKTEHYKYEIYMHCNMQDGILQTAFYHINNIKLGGILPVYELFIDKKRKQFVTLDYTGKWHTAVLDNLNWYFGTDYFRSGSKWISDKDSETIRNYLGGANGNYDALLKFQKDIRADELQKRHKKETDPWDEDLIQTPPLPKDWNIWAYKTGVPEHYIFYNYSRQKQKNGYCTHCGKEVTIKNPRYNAEGTCPECRHKIVYKSIGKAGTLITKHYYMYLIQRCRDGFMIRMFEGYCVYKKNMYRNPDFVNNEVRRVIYDSSAHPLRVYVWGNYKQCEYRWIAAAVPSSYWSYTNYSGMIYARALPSLEKKELKTFGLSHIIHMKYTVDPEQLINVKNKHPEIEKMIKAGLIQFAHEYYINKYSYSGKNINLLLQERRLAKMLCIDSQKLKRLRSANGGILFLEWLQYEKVNNKTINDDIITWYCNEKISPGNLKFINGKMSIQSIYNYIRRQMYENHMNSHDVITTWSDYLSMALRLGIDTNDEVVYKVRKLIKRHDELVEMCQDKAMTVRAAEIVYNFPHVEDIYHSLKCKYEFNDDVYSIIVPDSIEDVLKESKELHHCAGSSNMYWEQIEKRESFIVFLRRNEEIYKPFYTLEIEPSGAIRQKSTYFNRQTKDLDDAMLFLAKWQSEVSNRLHDSAQMLAQKSKHLRNTEQASSYNVASDFFPIYRKSHHSEQI